MTRITKATLDSLFSGRKAKWLSLYRRLHSRVSQIAGLELVPLSKSSQSVGLMRDGDKRPTIGRIRVTMKGLELGLAAGKDKPGKISHKILIDAPSQIDEEVVSRIKAAILKARTAKRRPT